MKPKRGLKPGCEANVLPLMLMKVKKYEKEWIGLEKNACT